MFLLQDVTTPGAQCWLVANERVVPLTSEQTIANFRRVGIPLLTFDPQSMSYLETELVSHPTEVTAS